MKMYDKIVYSYIDEIGNRLGEPSLYGAASLMVGAGFSKNADCIGDKKNTPPDWTQLSEAMYEALYPLAEDNEKRKWEECSGKNVLTLAQKYEVVFDRQSLNTLIERSIADKNYVPGDLHRRLLELNWNDIFTTNYDTLLERAIEQVATKRNYKIVHSQEDLPGSVRPRLVKLHGSIEHSGQYIITEEDYRTYPDKYAPFVNTVQQSMLETRLCLIGFSGSDPNFLSWLGWLRDNMGDNCPAIYLCGVFDNLGTAERKMLEQRHITVLDLSVLVDKDEKNKHYAALKRFIELLKERSEKKKESILSKNPYEHLDFWDKELNLDIAQYAKEMTDMVNQLIEQLDDYICLPKNEASSIGVYINNQLQLVLNMEYFEEKYSLINSFCAILKKCNYPLYDYIADKLLKVIKATNTNESIKCDDIVLYLLQMYRFDGKFDKYLQITAKIDASKFDGIRKKNEYWIECVKYYMCTFDVDKAYECLDKIEISSYDEYALKKASLLNQLNRKEEAKELITSTIAFISQQRYSENKNASLIGYANLVARASWTVFDDQELFSDSLYEDNMFNSRKVMIAARESIIETMFENQRPQNRRNSSFNPNSYWITYTIGSTNETKKMTASFNYLLLQDLLCIGVYRDHKNAIDIAVKTIEPASKSPLWRWYTILRTNDKNIYDLYFTRGRICCAQLEYVERFYEQIISLLEVGLAENKNREKIFVDYRTLTDIASKMTIVLDEDKIVKLIKVLIQIDTLFSDKDVKELIIYNALDILHYSFNSKILDECIEFILANKLLDYGFTSYFDGVEHILEESKEQQYREKLINSLRIELNSKDAKIRDNAVSKFKLFEKTIINSEWYDEIVEDIWSQVDDFGLPSNSTYLPAAWIEDAKHNAEEKVIAYLLNPQISSNHQARVISGGRIADTRVDIYRYYNVLYQMLNRKNNCLFSKNQLCSLIEYFCNYVNNEKKILDRDYDIMGLIPQTCEILVKINNTILLLCISVRVSNIYDEDIGKKFDKYLEQMTGLENYPELHTDYIKMVLREVDEEKIFAQFEKKTLYGDENEISSAFTMLYGVIQILQSQNKETVLDSLITQFVQKIPYFEMSIGKQIILEFYNVIRSQVFLKEENKACMINMLKSCYDIFKNAKEKHIKDGLDGMYNVSNLAKAYSVYLQENNIEIGTVFETLIDEFKACRLNEVKSKWL